MMEFAIEVLPIIRFHCDICYGFIL